jgi:hypothetical protein
MTGGIAGGSTGGGGIAGGVSADRTSPGVPAPTG